MLHSANAISSAVLTARRDFAGANKLGQGWQFTSRGIHQVTWHAASLLVPCQDGTGSTARSRLTAPAQEQRTLSQETLRCCDTFLERGCL